jgi:hypothetical protein
MSGGAYDYFYLKLEEIAIEKKDRDVRRLAVQKVVDALAKAMYEIEWVDSGDCSPGDEHEAIDNLMSVLGADPITILKAHAFDRLRDTFNDGAFNDDKR